MEKSEREKIEFECRHPRNNMVFKKLWKYFENQKSQQKFKDLVDFGNFQICTKQDFGDPMQSITGQKF